MSIASGIEIATGGRPEPEQTAVRPKGSGTVQSTERAHATAASSSSPSVPGGESFRSSWQSVLASLGASSGGRSEEETEGGGFPASMESAFAKAGRTAAFPISPPLSGAGLPWRPGRGAQGESAASAAAWTKAGSRTKVSALQVAPTETHRTTANSTAKSSANAKPTESASLPHPANRSKSAALETALGGPATLPDLRAGGSMQPADITAELSAGVTRNAATHTHSHR